MDLFDEESVSSRHGQKCKADHKKFEPPCNLCKAVCCQSSQRPFAVLLEKQDLERLPEAVPFAKKTTDGLVALPYMDGKCPFLSGTSCSVYDKRPELCREFNCVNGCQNGRLSFFLRDHPEVVEIIKQAYPDKLSVCSTLLKVC